MTSSGKTEEDLGPLVQALDILMIAAMGPGRSIGSRNGLPWGKVKTDMTHFRRATFYKTVVMGRKTFESLNCKPLKHRNNIVMTHDRAFSHPNVDVAHSVDDVLRIAATYRIPVEIDDDNDGDNNGADDTTTSPPTKPVQLVVIGGAEIYDLFMPYTRRMLLTTMFTNIEHADTYFPLLTMSHYPWSSPRVIETFEANEENVCGGYIHEYTRLDTE